MGKAKNIRIAPISSRDAAAIVKKYHYSGKIVNNSQLHFGVFLDGICEGAMQYGPSLDKRKIQRLVPGTPWNGFIELNRMAFSDKLPRNSESRAIAISFKLIKRHYPHLEWVVSFADGAQCGDGTIYRASGFLLTGIKKNNQIWAAPTGEAFSRMSLTDGSSHTQQAAAMKIVNRVSVTKGKQAGLGGASMKAYKAAGFVPIEGFQLRYMYFLNPAARERLTATVLPYSAIGDAGAGMYKGKKRPKQAAAGDQPERRRCDTDPDAP